MSNKYLKLSQAALPKCGQGKQEQSISTPVDLQRMARKVKGLICRGFPQWRQQRLHNEFPLPACVSAQGKSVVQQLSDVGARKAFIPSTWLSSSQTRHCPPHSSADEVTLTVPGVSPGSPAILCTSLVSCWSWGRSLLHHLKCQANVV